MRQKTILMTAKKPTKSNRFIVSQADHYSKVVISERGQRGIVAEFSGVKARQHAELCAMALEQFYGK